MFVAFFSLFDTGQSLNVYVYAGEGRVASLATILQGLELMQSV
ncbi:MAG: hypothetical protein WEE64_13875 [Dehalococcoidia bacterium]